MQSNASTSAQPDRVLAQRKPQPTSRDTSPGPSSSLDPRLDKRSDDWSEQTNGGMAASSSAGPSKGYLLDKVRRLPDTLERVI